MQNYPINSSGDLVEESIDIPVDSTSNSLPQQQIVGGKNLTLTGKQVQQQQIAIGKNQTQENYNINVQPISTYQTQTQIQNQQQQQIVIGKNLTQANYNLNVVPIPTYQTQVQAQNQQQQQIAIGKNTTILYPQSSSDGTLEENLSDNSYFNTTNPNNQIQTVGKIIVTGKQDQLSSQISSGTQVQIGKTITSIDNQQNQNVQINSNNIYITECAANRDTCYWGFSLIPKSFWLDQYGNRGRDFITLESNGYYVSCSSGGVISVGTVLSNETLWVPEKIGGKIAAFRSYYGGYLAIYEDGSVDCSERTVYEENEFNVLWSQLNCATDRPNYIILRNINGLFLSVDANSVHSANAIDATTVFKGHFWDPSTSSCLNQNCNTNDLTKSTSDQLEDNISLGDQTGKIVTGTGEVQTQYQYNNSTGKQVQLTLPSSVQQNQISTVISGKQNQITPTITGIQDQTLIANNYTTQSYPDQVEEDLTNQYVPNNVQCNNTNIGKQLQTVQPITAVQDQSAIVSTGKQLQTVQPITAVQDQSAVVSTGKQLQTVQPITAVQDQSAIVSTGKQLQTVQPITAVQDQSAVVSTGKQLQTVQPITAVQDQSAIVSTGKQLQTVQPITAVQDQSAVVSTGKQLQTVQPITAVQDQSAIVSTGKQLQTVQPITAVQDQSAIVSTGKQLQTVQPITAVQDQSAVVSTGKQLQTVQPITAVQDQSAIVSTGKQLQTVQPITAVQDQSAIVSTGKQLQTVQPITTDKQILNTPVQATGKQTQSVIQK